MRWNWPYLCVDALWGDPLDLILSLLMWVSFMLKVHALTVLRYQRAHQWLSIYLCHGWWVHDNSMLVLKHCIDLLFLLAQVATSITKSLFFVEGKSTSWSCSGARQASFGWARLWSWPPHVLQHWLWFTAFIDKVEYLLVDFEAVGLPQEVPTALVFHLYGAFFDLEFAFTTMLDIEGYGFTVLRIFGWSAFKVVRFCNSLIWLDALELVSKFLSLLVRDFSAALHFREHCECWGRVIFLTFWYTLAQAVDPRYSISRPLHYAVIHVFFFWRVLHHPSLAHWRMLVQVCSAQFLCDPRIRLWIVWRVWLRSGGTSLGATFFVCLVHKH